MSEGKHAALTGDYIDSVEKIGQNVELGNNKFGKCVLTIAEIPKGAIVAVFDGKIYEARKCTDLPKDIADHAIQIGEHTYQDSKGIARFINHSCTPNCGVHGLNKIVTMRDIHPGEELTWDYAMTEDSDWRVKCECGSHECRGIISYKFL